MFRKEVNEAKSKSRLGNVLIIQPISYTLISCFGISLALATLAFGYFGSYTKKATAGGLLMPEQGLLRISSTGSGIISRIEAADGSQVEKGQPLFVISAERHSVEGGTQKIISEQIKHREVLLKNARSLADERLASQIRMADTRLRSLNDELAQFPHEINLLERRVQLAKAHHARQIELSAASFVSVAQTQQAEADMLAIQGQVETLRRAKATMHREMLELESIKEDSILRHKSDISDIDNSLSLIRQDLAENNVRVEQVEVAPYSGTLTGTNVQLGQQVTAGSLLSSLIPSDSDIAAHIYVPAKQAGFIEVGQKVSLRYAAYPYQKFGMGKGVVAHISKSPYASQELPVHISSALQAVAGAPAQLFYRISVDLEAQDVIGYGKSHQLQAGMLLEADILQDRRRLYEWLLEPLFSITGKTSHSI
ncbi:hypothetical protein A7D25_01945 [Pseudomonas sp. 21C1]|nr:hypothetical protein A7D25_01945 [Pseudomonas sp. 21C1]